ncbi:unnamed protein product [Effrenium voratum]|nr:unnamed protein product [Effrenium voratum]
MAQCAAAMLHRLVQRVRWNYAKPPANESNDAKSLKSCVRKVQGPSHYEELQRRRLLQKQTGIAEDQELPEPTEAWVEATPVSPRPGGVAMIFRRRTMKLRQWLGGALRPSLGPALVEGFEDPSSEPPDKLDSETRNHFLAAFLTGDLEVLDHCLQACASQHGQRAFVAMAKEGEITLAQWLRVFRATAIKKTLQELGDCYEEESLQRAFLLLQRLTALPRQQIGEDRPERSRAERPGGKRSMPVVIFTDFEEARHQVFWSEALAQRLVRGTAAEALGRESVRRALPETLAKALDGLSPALRLSRAAARHCQRGLFQQAGQELRLLWALSALEPLELASSLGAARHLGYVIRCAARAILAEGADPAAPCAVDEEETLLLALKLAQELHRQRHHMKEPPASDSALFGALEPRSLVLALAVLGPLLDRELVTRGEQLCGPELWQRIASQLLGAWQLLEDLPGAELRPLMADLARLAGLAPPWVHAGQAPLALRVAAAASGSHQAKLSQHLVRPARVPPEGLEALLSPAPKMSAAASRRAKPLKAAPGTEQARDALEKVIASLDDAEEAGAKGFARCAVLHGVPFLAERLAKDFPGCLDVAKRLLAQLRAPMQEVCREKPEAEGSQLGRRRQVCGSAVLEAELREVRRSWNGEMEVQWFEFLRLADSEDAERSDLDSEMEL